MDFKDKCRRANDYLESLFDDEEFARYIRLQAGDPEEWD